MGIGGTYQTGAATPRFRRHGALDVTGNIVCRLHAAKRHESNARKRLSVYNHKRELNPATDAFEFFNECSDFLKYCLFLGFVLRI